MLTVAFCCHSTSYAQLYCICVMMLPYLIPFSIIQSKNHQFSSFHFQQKVHKRFNILQNYFLFYLPLWVLRFIFILYKYNNLAGQQNSILFYECIHHKQIYPSRMVQQSSPPFYNFQFPLIINIFLYFNFVIRK